MDEISFLLQPEHKNLFLFQLHFPFDNFLLRGIKHEKASIIDKAQIKLIFALKQLKHIRELFWQPHQILNLRRTSFKFDSP